MLPSLLLPETLAHDNGQGKDIFLSASPSDSPLAPLRITMEITRILEQESLNVSVMGSADGSAWRRVAAFPPKSYCGKYSLFLDMANRREVRMLRVDWSMTRWNASSRPPVFGFSVMAEEAKALAAAV